MSLRDTLINYCMENSDQRSPPESINISEIEPTSQVPKDNIEIKATWFDPEYESEFFYLDSGQLYHKLEDIFSTLHSRITLHQDATLGTLSFNVLFDDDGPFIPSPDFDFGAIVSVNYQTPITSKGNNLLELACDEIHELDKTVTLEDITELEVYFDDWAICELTYIGAHLQTKHPHKFYSDVNTLEEYIDVLVRRGQDRKKLEEKTDYEVFVRLDDYTGESPPPEPFTTTAENLITERIERLATVEGTWMYEADQIIIENNTEETMFYIRIPFIWG